VPERLAVVWCPQWPVIAAGAAADEPLAVLHGPRVVARSTAAARAGVRVGMRRREAQARCPEIRLVAHEPLVARRAFQPVVDAVASFVPRLEVDHPGTITFATRGPSRYFGGDAAMAARILAAVDQVLGAATTAAGPPGLGIGDGRFAARVAAQATAHRPERVLVVAPGGARAHLAPLPLRWLLDAGEVTPDLVGLFGRLGLRTLGDVAGLAEADVLARFGHPGARAWRMASGADDRPVGAEVPPEGLAVVHHFEQPVHHLDIAVFAGRALAEALVQSLAADGRVCTRFVAVAETDHGETCEREWSLSTGFSTAAMVERLRWQLDGWARIDATTVPALRDEPRDGREGRAARVRRDLGDDPIAAAGQPTSGIVRLHLEPLEVRADDGVQLGLWGGRRQADEWARRSAARLAGLVGDDQVVVAEWRGGRHPSDVHRWVPASLSTRFEPGSTGTSDAATGTPAHGPAGPAGVRPPWPGALPMPSPATLHLEPLAVRLVDRSGRPVAVDGRGQVSAPPVAVDGPAGERVGITAWAGPWLVDERWWDPLRRRRLARVQVLTADGSAHLAVLERGQWWLAATYD
jgi:protein ImuB